MSNRKLEIPFEVADGIVVASLLDQYNYLLTEQAELEKQIETGEFEDYQGADFIANKRIMAHIKGVLQYYGSDTDDV